MVQTIDVNTPSPGRKAVPQYYKDIRPLSLAGRFSDHDDAATFPIALKRIFNFESKNFVLDFGATEAWNAFDLDVDDVTSLLNTTRPTSLETRWINIWLPDSQIKLVKAIGRHYGLSRRLLGLMCSQHQQPADATNESKIRLHYGYGPSPGSQSRQLLDYDIENGTAMLDLEDGGRSSGNAINHYQLVDDIWHFMSVDPGPKYLCIGYNSLQEVPSVKQDALQDARHPNCPEGKRIWMWLLICDDDTIITIQENPFPFHTGELDRARRDILAAVRRNIHNVFYQISEVDKPPSLHNPLFTLSLRQDLPKSEEAGNKSHIEASDQRNRTSLLFFYLFEDWYSSYSLIAHKEHQYSSRLEDLRRRMAEKPNIEHVKDLHVLGQKLAVLKRIYNSYELIIDRILQRQSLLQSKSTSSVHEDTDVERTVFSHSSCTSSPETQDSSLGVLLSPAAVDRFQRLKDRIQLYALSEIDECLHEKEDLVFLSFNLIGLKDSQAVERLTRITILLAKVTILFLPVSLTTAYFSTSIPELQDSYSAKTFWIAFAVVFVLTTGLLVVFGFISDTVEGKPVYRSIWQMTFDISRTAWRRRRAGRKDDI